MDTLRVRAPIARPGYLALWPRGPHAVALLVMVAATRLARSPATSLRVVLIELVLATLRKPSLVALSGFILCVFQTTVVLLAVHRERRVCVHCVRCASKARGLSAFGAPRGPSDLRVDSGQRPLGRCMLRFDACYS